MRIKCIKGGGMAGAGDQCSRRAAYRTDISRAQRLLDCPPPHQWAAGLDAYRGDIKATPGRATSDDEPDLSVSGALI